MAVCGDDSCNGDVTNRHSNCADGEDWLTPDFVDVEDGWNCCEEHYDPDDAGCEERDGVRGETKRRENRRGVVEDCIDAGPLLEKHGHGSDDDALEHCLRLEERSDCHELQFEDVPCCQFTQVREVLCDSALLKQALGFDFQEFELHKFMVGRQITQTCEHFPGFVFAIMMYQPTRGEWHKENTREKDNCWEKL